MCFLACSCAIGRRFLSHNSFCRCVCVPSRPAKEAVSMKGTKAWRWCRSGRPCGKQLANKSQQRVIRAVGCSLWPDTDYRLQDQAC